jgi:hypothetical protein
MALVATAGLESWKYAGCSELRALYLRFSTGVTIAELTSVAVVVATMADLPPPSRAAKRSWVQLVGWFRSNWSTVAGFLPWVELRDSEDRAVDGVREMCERGMVL